MQFRSMAAGAIALSLAACGQSEQPEYVEASADYAVAEEAAMEMPPPPPAAVPNSSQVVERLTTVDIEEAPASEGVEPEQAVSAPQIAYRYTMGFRVPASAIKPLSERHADLCEAMGPRECRIIEMGQSDGEGDYGYGNLRLAVKADKARAFTKQLEETSGEMDGEVTGSSISGEDLSKQIVDTEAKLRARTTLRDRLMEVLRTRKGSVQELVEAERAVAQVNQEIDQARSWLNEMRGRVAFSQIDVSYTSGAPSSGGFTDPIRDAFGSIGSILGGMIAFFILAITVLLPIALVIGLIWFASRKVGSKFFSPQSTPTYDEDRPSARVVGDE